MSIKTPTNAASARQSALAQSSMPLTAANLAVHERNTATISPDHAIRQRLVEIERSHDLYDNAGSSERLAGSDEVAKAIEAAVHVDGHSQE